MCYTIDMRIVEKTFKIKGEPGKYYLKGKFKPSNQKVKVFLNKNSRNYKSGETYKSLGYLLNLFDRNGKRTLYFCPLSLRRYLENERSK